MPPRLVLVDGKKQCTKCSEWKPLEDFVTAINTTTGKAASCKVCVNSGRLDRYHNDLEFRAKFKAQTKKSKLKLKYGLSVEDYESLIKKQKNKCKICDIEFNNKSQTDSTVVDHCHKTGIVRGLLCRMCNLGIGNFKDNPKYLILAASYLRDSINDN